ncbi:SCO family protein [Advenella mimigardefordensis]|uniref:Putative thioredoxin-like fold domain-containing protein n=1 Tax=Advenella mimigardefordensis (strain DSM 17166 / LMG 22922 / DPN7) TaxID=1247726 RepID=W0PCI3_ADVMD|nr:SCO family protein [Advenella mimigardefordensis]AHG64599.1 putative thioredoxin-like fold domain-containing protein [Advenella mimigardefordensis DPN7]
MIKRSEARSAIAFVIVVLLGLAAFAAVTAGFAAVTSDGVRRVQLQHNPRTLPDLPLVDSRGTPSSLRDYGKASEKVTFVTLVYLQCQSICRTSIAGQSWMQHAIYARGLQDQVRLLTLSFDPLNDSPQVMAEHAKRMGVNADLWRFATVRNQADLNRMLALFNIIVLPDGLGDYSHNAALFLIDEQGRLARAYDIDRPDLALADYLANSKGKGK